MEADVFFKDYFRKRASAHTIVREGQQHMAMVDRKRMAGTLSHLLGALGEDFTSWRQFSLIRRQISRCEMALATFDWPLRLQHGAGLSARLPG